MIKWLSWYPNSETLSNSNSGCGRLLFDAILEKALGEDTHNVFSILKGIFVMVLTLLANVLSWPFDKVKIVIFKE